MHDESNVKMNLSFFDIFFLTIGLRRSILMLGYFAIMPGVSRSGAGGKMNWNKDRSVMLTRICVAVFAAALLAADIFGARAISWWIGFRQMESQPAFTRFALSLYSLSVPAWICLWSLWKLLSNISAGQVFTEQNISLLRTVSWVVAAAAAICFASGFYYPPFFFGFAAAAFMVLIVRVVKNCFREALDMRSELDLTI